MKKRLIPVIFVLILAFSGCSPNIKITDNPPPPEPETFEVLFLEHVFIIDGKIIKEGYPVIQIDFPNYTFNMKLRQLQGGMDFEIDDNLILILGESISYRGDIGEGTSSGLSGVESLPYLSNYNEQKFEIEQINSDGSVYIQYNKKSIKLKPGDIWENEEKLISKKGTGQAEIIIRDTISNHGFLKNYNIKNW